MKPYYQQDGITIYHGDCREVLPALAADVLVTDPPYGINIGAADTRGPGHSAGKHGLARGTYGLYQDTYENYVSTVCPAIETALCLCVRAAVFTGPHLQELPKATSIGGIYCPSGSGRHAWGFKTFFPVLFYGSAPNLHKGAQPTVLQSNSPNDPDCRSIAATEHPCSKPVAWMRWLVALASQENETVLDPFMGSGTTLVAAKVLGRRAIGIEIEERYCEIAAKRLAQGVLFGAEVA